ncbi:glutamate racemase (plasmid) [Cetobacterium somerae]|uniref:glutamate racemase n=1 Tax=Cetobacterium somerae TaxID=188913 RepID=UPI002E7AB188|nr:glutamate racemase [Cetobacterium somerae]WVJ02732.1 glutamate racemase [Cetobacterium somerae]
MRTIGVFDSGVGGVSVLKEVIKEFPYDNIIYFGDSLHAPYGDREIEEIRALCLKVSDFLVYEKKVDAIVIACNTATGAAMYIMKERYHIPVVGVVNNGVKEGIRVTKNKNIGVIATPATIKMNIYLKEFNRIDKNLNIYQVKCPLFVGMIEKGWIDNDESNQLIKGYLSNLPENVDTLILGCTHYPLIEKYIKRHFTENIVDPAKETAKSLKLIIGEGASSKKTSIKFFVSGDSQKFKEVAQEFLGTAIDEVEKIIL